MCACEIQISKEFDEINLHWYFVLKHKVKNKNLIKLYE